MPFSITMPVSTSAPAVSTLYKGQPMPGDTLLTATDKPITITAVYITNIAASTTSLILADTDNVRTYHILHNLNIPITTTIALGNIVLDSGVSLVVSGFAPDAINMYIFGF